MSRGQAPADRPRLGQVKIITSLANPEVKAIRGLARKKNRDAEGRFMAEGLKLVADAADAGWRLETLVYGHDLADHPLAQKHAAGCKSQGGLVLEVSLPVLRKICQRDNPQSAIGVFHQAWTALDTIDPDRSTVWVALQGIKDPGNLGTVIRTVDSVGASGVILVGETCDPFSLEAVRATMGSVFHVPLSRASAAEFIAWRAGWPGPVIGTHLAGSKDYRQIDYREPMVLVMGNEQSGLPEDLAAACSNLARIPMAGQADSLNLAIATGVMLYEMRRAYLPPIGNTMPVSTSEKG